MAATIGPNGYTHTRALLAYLFTTYSKNRRVDATSPLLLGVKGLALHGLASSSTSTESGDDDAEDVEGEGHESTAPTSAASSASDVASDEDRIDSVLKLLEDGSIEEEDRPEALKELLSSCLISASGELIALDPLILSLLHRHREDLNPSSTPVPPLPSHGSTTPQRPSVSRSSSFRRNFSSGAPLAMSAVRSPTPSLTAPHSNLPSASSSSSGRSAPSSPFRTESPALFNRSTHVTPAHSPWSSPRPLALTLSAAAMEFKFSTGAAEFRPGSSGGLSATGSGFGAPGSGAGTPLRSRSPVNPHQAQANWAFTASPLGTPKYGMAAGGGLTTPSNFSSPSYFSRHLEANALKEKIPRLPWADATDSSGDSLYDDEGGYDEVEGYGERVGYEQGEWLDQAPIPNEHEQLEQGSWNPFGDGEEEYGYGDGGQEYTPTYEVEGVEGEGGVPSFDFEGRTGLGGMGAYSMTPFDVLHSVLAGTDVSAAILEEALVMSGWDVDQAIEYIIDTQPQGGSGTRPLHLLDGLSAPPSPMPQSRIVVPSGTGSRPLVVSRDSFEGYVGGNGGRGSQPMMGGGAARWQPMQQGSGALTPTGSANGDGRGVGGRVCRYYLSGNCLRSDCRFSHEVSKAVCRFWLRGHCLKGDQKCDFLHSIPPIMRADFEQRARHRSESITAPHGYDEQVDETNDFPTLGEAPRPRRQPGQSQGGPSQPGPFTRTISLDPSRSRFAGAVKFGRVAALPPPPRPIASGPAMTRNSLPKSRPSARINLRPPALLPTLPTGAALAQLYIRYRSSFLELGANRNKCLARAAECWKRGDGAGARKWSREAQDWNRQVAIEGKDSATRIVAERNNVIRDALSRHDGKAGSTDGTADRRVRGHDRAGGICLGVVSPAVLSRNERMLTAEERTEIALDCHGLHPDEAISFLDHFLSTLERERFPGLAYVVIGQGKHSGQTDPDLGAVAGRVRLEQSVSEFVSDQGWAWQMFGGIIAVDALR